MHSEEAGNVAMSAFSVWTREPFCQMFRVHSPDINSEIAVVIRRSSPTKWANGIRALMSSEGLGGS